MVTIRSVNDIVLGLLDFFRVAQPDLDTKPGTVARDLFVDAPASHLSLLYDELSKISTLQSLRLAIGSDLDKLAQNFGAQRKTSTKLDQMINESDLTTQTLSVNQIQLEEDFRRHKIIPRK